MHNYPNRVSNEERSAQMRTRLIAAARALFVKEGFANTSTPQIVAEAGVTRGALYHHFLDKLSIFKAVLEAESEAVALAINSADGVDGTALMRLFSGARAYLQAMQIAGRTRLLLLDGPSLLGWDDLHAIEAKNGDARLKIGLLEAIDAGEIDVLPIETLVSFMSAVFERAAIDISRGLSEEQAMRVIEAMLKGLTIDRVAS